MRNPRLGGFIGLIPSLISISAVMISIRLVSNERKLLLRSLELREALAARSAKERRKFLLNEKRDN